MKPHSADREDTHGNILRFFFAVSLAIYIGFAAYYYGSSTGVFGPQGYPLGRDFINYWAASALLLIGQPTTPFAPSEFHSFQQMLLGGSFPLHLWSYPPSAFFFIWPLALLPYMPAYVAWLAVTYLFYVFAPLGYRARGKQLVALLLAPATVANALAGQNGFLTAGLLLAGLAILDRRPVLAGVCFGLLTFKPQLGILIPVALIGARQWGAIASAIVTAGALFIVSAAAFGKESWEAYLTTTRELHLLLVKIADGIQLNMIPSPFASARLLGLSGEASGAVQIAFTLAGAAFVYWAFRHPARDRPLQFAALLAATALGTPYIHVYDLTLLSLPIIWLYVRGSLIGFLPGERYVLFFAWILPILVIILNVHGVPLGPVILIALMAIIGIRLRQAPGAERDAL